MIKTPLDLESTQQYVQSIERTLADLREKLAMAYPDRFGLLARPYLAEIAAARSAVEEYLRGGLGNFSADVVLSLKGIAPGNAPLGVVTSVVDTFRRSVLTLGSALSGRAPGTGRAGREIEDACELRLAFMEAGSIRFGLDLPESSQLEIVPLAALGGRATRLFVDVATWANGDEPAQTLTQQIRPLNTALVAWQVLKVRPPQTGPVTEITLSGRLTNGHVVRLSDRARQRLTDFVSGGQEVRQVSETGVVRAMDLDAGTFTLRKRPNGKRPLRCMFDPLFLESQVIAVAGRHAVATGGLVIDPITGKERVLLVVGVAAAEATKQASPE